jgi:hypothetical protein
MNPLKYITFFNTGMLCIFLTVYLCVLYDPQNKQELFPLTELINWTL